MTRKRSNSGFYQSLESKGTWKVGEVTAYEEHLPNGFFEMVGRRAALNAINENRAMNLPVTGIKNGWVVREMPDGSQERISEIHLIPSEEYKERKLIKGAVIHVGKKVKRMRVFAGPNGSGKSTIIKEIQKVELVRMLRSQG